MIIKFSDAKVGHLEVTYNRDVGKKIFLNTFLGP